MSEVTISVKMPIEAVVGNKGYDEVLWAGKSGPVMFKKVSYDEWRKHYAKNAKGQYRGTEEPAPDCLLLPEEDEKWRGVTADEEGVEDGNGDRRLEETKQEDKEVNDARSEETRVEAEKMELENYDSRRKDVTDLEERERRRIDSTLNQGNVEPKRKWWKRASLGRGSADVVIS